MNGKKEKEWIMFLDLLFVVWVGFADLLIITILISNSIMHVPLQNFLQLYSSILSSPDKTASSITLNASICFE